MGVFRVERTPDRQLVETRTFRMARTKFCASERRTKVVSRALGGVRTAPKWRGGSELYLAT